MAMAAAFCPGRLVFTLEGGYNLAALASGVSAVLSTLAGDSVPQAAEGNPAGAAIPAAARPSRATQSVIESVLQTLRPFWDLS